MKPSESESRLAANWPMLRPWIGTLVRLVVGVVWIWASLDKLANPLKFVQAVRAYDATPEWLSKAIGYGLPVLELCIGILLIIGISMRIAAAASALLFLVFLIGLVQAAVRGIQIECGCFGGGGATDTGTTYTWDITRDLLLLTASVYLVLWPLTHLSIEYYLTRHDYVAPPSAKRMRTPEGRRRYEAQLAAKAATAKSRNAYVNTSISIVALLIALIGIGVQAGRAKIHNVVAGTNATVSQGIVFGKKAAATVDIYEDFGCPVCRDFEQATHVQLEKDVRANLAQVRYHPISILDGSSPNRYSTRASNAAVCASDISVETFLKYHDILYGTDAAGNQVQPREGTSGPGDTKLISFGKQAGMKTAQVTTFSQCVSGQTYQPLVKAMTDKASQNKINSTPTILVNGKQLANHDAATLFDAIAAAGKGHTPSPSKTPTPKPSVSVTPSSSSSVSPSSSPSASSSSS